MARHPALQAQNRFRELSPLLDYAIHDLRNKKFEQREAELILDKATGEYLTAYARYTLIKSLLDRLAQNDGLYPWGLPRTITIAEFKSLVPDADIPDIDPSRKGSQLMSALWIGGAALLAMAVVIRVPTLKTVHIGIVVLRASCFMAREMWDGALSRRSRWDECVHRAKFDI